MVYKKVKPVLDWIGAALLLLILSPLLLLIIAVLGFFQRGRVFFLQDRPGLHGKYFKLIKFTSMVDQGDVKLVTPLGRFMRKTSIDELPQLINVLKGEMSLIGPRPLLTEYMELYSKEQRRRHEVLPGITGWTQVNGRTSISWQKKFELDLYYVDHISFSLDLQILIKTIAQLFTATASDVPEEKFTGWPR